MRNLLSKIGEILKSWGNYLASCDQQEDTSEYYTEKYFFDEALREDIGSYRPPLLQPSLYYTPNNSIDGLVDSNINSLYFTTNNHLEESSDPIFRDPPLPRSVFY